MQEIAAMAEGILCAPSGCHSMKSHLHRNQGFTLVEIMVVVVLIGLLAAIALPAFRKISVASQDKAVLNNARQLYYAADSYYLESGSAYAASTSLIGPGNYVKSLSVVAQEIYPAHFTQSITLTVTNVGGARTITYSP